MSFNLAALQILHPSAQPHGARLSPCIQASCPSLTGDVAIAVHCRSHQTRRKLVSPKSWDEVDGVDRAPTFRLLFPRRSLLVVVPMDVVVGSDQRRSCSSLTCWAEVVSANRSKTPPSLAHLEVF